MKPLLEIRNLKKYFPIHSGLLLRQTGTVYAVDGVSLEVEQGKTLGLVGESGCGKSTLGRTVMNLYLPTSGEILFEGQNMASLDHKSRKAFCRDAQMIFQDPYSSLNPRMKVGHILSVPFKVHLSLQKEEQKERLEFLINKVNLGPWALPRYPHEFSGGQRQRIAIARAIALNPKLIVADEPVSALDVSVQAQILNLMKRIQEELGVSYLFISHHLAVIQYMADDIAVMYLGEIVEKASRDDFFRMPLHPYTRALLDANPVMGQKRKKQHSLAKGDVPSPVNPPSGCRFHPRCALAELKKDDRCKSLRPELKQVARAHWVACHFVDTMSD